MSNSQAIGMVSQALQKLLVEEMKFENLNVKVTLLAPDEPGDNPRVNLFLYKVQEHAILKNADWQVKKDNANRLVPPPLSLTLFYLMTPYTLTNRENGNVTVHHILGEAMRVLYENPVIPAQYLEEAGLIDAREQIKIMQNTLDLEELSRVWSTFTQPFRLSVLYQVSVVQIDALAGERLLPKRVRQIGVPPVGAPFSPPVVDELEPLSAPRETMRTFRGRHLAGWRVYVTVMGQRIVDGQELTEDQFTVSLPPDLQSGFYEMRVDISHLCRRTFFFEVI